MTTLVDRILPPKPSDEEVAKGKPVRDAFREQVKTLQTQLDESKSGLQELKLQDSEKLLETTLKKATSWLDANVEVTKRQVDAEQIRFKEDLQNQFLRIQKEIPIATNKLSENIQKTIATSITIPQIQTTVQKSIDNLRKRAKQAAEKAKVELQNRDLSKDFDDAWKLFVKYGGTIILILLALRVGAFAANASLHEPVGIRIFNFIYAVLFFPIFILYYGFFEIRHLLWPDECEALRVESMLPIYGYVKDKNPISLADRFFGYPETEKLLQDITNKKEIIEQRRLDVLKISRLAELTSGK